MSVGQKSIVFLIIQVIPDETFLRTRRQPFLEDNSFSENDDGTLHFSREFLGVGKLAMWKKTGRGGISHPNEFPRLGAVSEEDECRRPLPSVSAPAS
jgi:hypothetical protein